jgi:hypothetical protein
VPVLIKAAREGGDWATNGGGASPTVGPSAEGDTPRAGSDYLNCFPYLPLLTMGHIGSAP